MNARFSLPRSLLAVSLLISGLQTAGCNKSAMKVNLTKQPLKVETCFFEDRPELESRRKDLDYAAFTEWFLHCNANVHTKVLEEDSTPGASSVSLMIESIDLVLSCPIQICRSRKASPLLIQHENGHVEICRRIYEKADVDVGNYSRSLIGKKIYGMGGTLSEAKESALSRVYQAIAEIYRRKVIWLCNKCNENFDDLSERYRNNVSNARLVEMSLSQVIEL